MLVVLASLPCPTAAGDVSDKVVFVGCILALVLLEELVEFCCPTTLEGVDNVDIAVGNISDKLVCVDCTLASDLLVELVVFCCPTTLEGSSKNRNFWMSKKLATSGQIGTNYCAVPKTMDFKGNFDIP